MFLLLLLSHSNCLHVPPDAVASRYRRDDTVYDNNSSSNPTNGTRFDIVHGSISKVQDVANFTAIRIFAFSLHPWAKITIQSRKLTWPGASWRVLYKGNVAIWFMLQSFPRGTGVGILDAKREIEDLIQSSGVPYTILRCGTYMEDAFDPRISLLKAGWFLFPIDRTVPFCYTSQKDIPRFIVSQLLIKQNNQPLNGAINFCDPNVYKLSQVEQELTQAAGKTIRLTPKFPIFYIFRAFLPLFRLLEHRFSSVIPLMQFLINTDIPIHRHHRQIRPLWLSASLNFA